MSGEIFQFPLWDTNLGYEVEFDKHMNFQFPLWDTGIKTIPFNTSRRIVLSIPFMGYHLYY